jgi:hypothetical protein
MTIKSAMTHRMRHSAATILLVATALARNGSAALKRPGRGFELSEQEQTATASQPTDHEEPTMNVMTSTRSSAVSGNQAEPLGDAGSRERRASWFGRRGRRALAGIAITMVASGIIGVSAAAPASAAGTTGQYTTSTCGWYLQAGAPNSFVDYKVSMGNLPWVSGTTTSYQRVWTLVRFWHPNSTGWSVYRSGWYYTYARAGYWTKTWTAYANGQTNQVTAQDLAPESGYTGAELHSQDTRFSVDISWMTGSSVTGTAAEWATAPNNANNLLVCNGGGNIA